MPQFVPPSYGWFDDGSGHTWQSDDNGETWREVFAADLDAVAFADRNHGWMQTYDVRPKVHDLYRTQDAGKTWQKCGTIEAADDTYPRYASFLNPKTGWAIVSITKFDRETNVGVAATSNGGCSWHLLWKAVPAEYDHYHAPFFLNAREGWLGGGYFGRLLMTKDGGSHWELLPRPPASGSEGIFIQSVYFVSSMHGWILLSSASRTSVPMYETLDGASHWHRLTAAEIRDEFSIFSASGSGLQPWREGAFVSLALRSQR